jgi:hypothetical protein
VNARFEVVHGNPGDEELAVVVALLTAAANSATDAPAPEQSLNWARTPMRVTYPAGPGAWWRSGLPAS